jgi:L-aspartate oxidase
MPVRGDFLVIGSGIAGLRAALSLAAAGRVIVLTKADPRESNTGYAQGGIAAAVGPDDSPDLHARDTIAAGDGLCVPDAVQVLVQDGPRYVRELLEWGAFDRDGQGRPALTREAAHSVRRVLHARDATGRQIGQVLREKVAGHRQVTLLGDAAALSLVTQDGACVGARFLDRAGQVDEVHARATLVATGGAGQVFRETTNPAIATGDGIAMAFDAGARVTDLEFVQFHPTALSVPGAPRFLLSEALRGEGARLVNRDGERFMTRYEAAGDLASRDLVSRAIVKEALRTGGPIYLTMAHLDPGYVRGRFPTIAAVVREAGLDLATDRIPVSPAAHYAMGGIETDLDGRTSIPGLFAAGEAACTGVHGANRLASNSLLEGLVFGARAAAAMAGSVQPARLFAEVRECPAWYGLGPGRREPDPDEVRELSGQRQTGLIDAAMQHQMGTARVPAPGEVRDLMWQHVGLVRTRDGLIEATARLSYWQEAVKAARDVRPGDDALRRVASLVTVGSLIAHAALRREESRGGHFRADYPQRDDARWQLHVADVIAR